MAMLQEMLRLLAVAFEGKLERKENVREFQQRFWDNQLDIKGSSEPEVYEILADLAHDLEFFEADAGVRAGESTYYGHERLEQEIKTALQRLLQLGITVPVLKVNK